MMDMNGSFAEGYAVGRDAGGNSGNNGNGMWGDNWAWIIIILFALLGRNGFGNGDNGNSCCNSGNGGVSYVLPYPGSGFSGNSYTDASIQRGFDNQAVVNKLDGISNGICSLGYDQLSQMNALGTAVASGFAGVNNAICNLGYEQAQLNNATNVALMQGNNAIQSQLASCCCDLRTGQMQTQNAIQSCCCETGRAIERGFCDTNYNLATNTTSIIQNAHNDTDRVLAKLDAMEMNRKDETIAALREKLTQANFAASQAAQNAFIQANQDAQTAEILRRTGHDCPTAAYVVQPPTPVTFPTNCCGSFSGYGWGYNNSGCNSGCNSCGC